jgi:hypothetical protein
MNIKEDPLEGRIRAVDLIIMEEEETYHLINILLMVSLDKEET